MIRADHISKRYGQRMAVDDISFQVSDGETLVLLGTSGCGKTTTLRMINRLTEPDSGHIEVNGRDIRNQLPELLRRGIGYVLQDNSLFPHYTVEENISVVPSLLGWSKDRMRERSSELLDKLHLSARFLSSYPRQLSGGQQQRVGLARALAADPAILLMDEPFGSLDPITRKEIRKEFKALDELKRKTVILVTHDIPEAFELADRICLMNNGRIEQTGTPFELLFFPASDFVSLFLDEHRLGLELETVDTDTLWDFLPESNSQEASAQLLSPTNLKSILGCFTGGPSETLGIEKDNKIKSVSFSALMNAFVAFKKAQKHE